MSDLRFEWPHPQSLFLTNILDREIERTRVAKIGICQTVNERTYGMAMYEISMFKSNVFLEYL